MNLTSLSLTGLKNLLQKKEVKAQEVVQAYLERIEEMEPQINSFITVLGDRSLEEAGRIDRKKSPGNLAGIPLAIKDNMVIQGLRSTCGSKILENYKGSYTASAVEKLMKQDAAIIGKTNLDEFAMGSSTENSAFYITRNPWDRKRVPGGSSGGSAAAVASGEAPAALGSDTGGSIRQPAAFCGLVGFKPTYGRVSRYGLIAFASSLDQIGPITKTVEDSAFLTQLIAGRDPQDSTSSSHPVPQYPEEMKKDLKSMRVGYLKQEMLEGIDPEVKEIYSHSLGYLEDLGAELQELSFPVWKYGLFCYYIIAPCEASSNLARYDGVRYGFRHNKAPDLSQMYENTRTEGFGSEVKRRILLGTFALSAGYYEAYYVKAAKTRDLIRKEFEDAFQKVDFIVTPTTPDLPFLIGAKKDPISMYLSDWFTAPVSLAGIPALSLPVGFSQKKLPVGLQIIGNFFQESNLFKLAFRLEKKVKLSGPNLHRKEEE
ncbi:Asp-tRNA(Asn)/Glu-tRNA(Gln) amidotransferase subunit GatA [bacterium]|nr:Asp-tRNA(Asn)/Glu-tRNA(Gln) amidotransferase subunit GatA [bacterium]